MAEIITPAIVAVLLQASGLSAQSSTINTDEYKTCGLTSLYVICRFHDLDVTWDSLKRQLGPPGDGGVHSFADLARTAQQLGLAARGFHLTSDELLKVPTPAIIQTRSGFGAPEPHLLVLVHCTSEGVYLLDPPYPVYLMPWQQFNEVWTGNVLLLVK